MTAEPGSDLADPSPEPVKAAASFWTRVNEHKIIQWGIAYLGTSLALGQGQQLVAEALQWPDAIGRIFVIVLIAGLPIALTLAWYHGHRGLQRVTAGELTIISLLVLIGAVFFTVAIRPSTERAAAAPAEVEAGAPTTARRSILPNSVAVLPLENLGDPANALYANAMHGEIISQLTKLRNLTVINRESMLPYAANRPPLRQIAEELRVQALLTGRVQYAAGRFKVNVDLVDPDSDVNSWSESYEGELGEFFAAQADIAMNVANELRAAFSAEEQARIERPPTDSAVAYEFYLQALYLTGVGNQAPRMQQLLDAAIGADPKFAAAYGAKALLYATELINTTVGSARSPEILGPLIAQNVSTALSLDPESMAALQARTSLSLVYWRWTEVQSALERLYEITGSSQFNSTWFWSWSGNEAEALRVAEREVDLNPRSWGAHLTHGFVLNYAKDHAAAVSAFREAIAVSPTLAPTYASLAIPEAARGNLEEARRALVTAEELLGANRNIITLLDIAYGYGRIGDLDNARKLVGEIEEAVRGGQDIGAGGQALLHLAVGQHDEALAWLRRGAEKAARHEHDAGFYSLMNLKLNYGNDPVLDRPGFVEVRNRLVGD